MPDEHIGYNCSCDDEHDAETLEQLRRRVIRRLGYAAQAANPPPGMADLIDDFLTGAQRQLYRRYDALRTERIFTWELEEGVRFYGLKANLEAQEGEEGGEPVPAECDVLLDPHKVTWIGVEDRNRVWYPLTKGIPPEFYTMSQEWVGWPSRYEIRQCVEIFPAPSAGMRFLRVKGHFGLQPFSEDEHKTTIDSELVFLHALGAAKKHYRQFDADDVFAQLNSLLGGIVAGSHQTARYIPGKRPIAPATPPVFLPLIGGGDD